MRYHTVALMLTFIIISFITIFFLFRNLDSKCTVEVDLLHQKVNTPKKGKEEYFLVVLILSSPRNVQRRNILRNTWLKFCKEVNVKYYFAVGTKFISQPDVDAIYNEYHNFKDLIVIENVQDSYSYLTSKTLEAYVWLDENLRYKYTLKCDDDSFVNVQELVKLLKDYEGDSKQLYLGFFNGHATVQQVGKWKESNWILCDHYLPYALGGGYVLSEELVKFIARNAEDLELFLSEDVSVGVWLASKAKINRVHSPRFNTEFKSRGCSNSYIVSHKHTEAELEDLYNNLKLTGKICEKEFQTRLSYDYNWSVPPSKCCRRTDNVP